MQVIDTVAGWRKALDKERAGGVTVGLVPTMGALHAGHASLIDRAGASCGAVAVTIFVNPLQFGASEDLSAYPRPLEADLALAEAHGATHVFTPSVEEMYPRPLTTTVTAGPLAERWEGPSRPGHFDGVATVVTKLFSQAGPCHAFFGEKDYQQLCIIRRLVSDLDIPVVVEGCATVREPDGLALSSRNVYLTPSERAIAPVLHQALQAGAAAGTPEACRQAMATTIATQPAVDLIYADVVDAESLEPQATFTAPSRLLIAARLGRTRLIDNIGVTH